MEHTENENRVKAYAKAFAFFSVGCLALAIASPVLGIRDLQNMDVIYRKNSIDLRSDTMKMLESAIKTGDATTAKALAKLAGEL